MIPKIRRMAVAFLAMMIVIGLVSAGIYFLLLGEDSRFEGIPTIYPYVNDNAGALTQDYRDWIDSICLTVDVNTSCEIAVLIVNTTQPNDISYFALRVFQKNEIGKEGKDNGVLVVVAAGDRTWKIEVGYGLMGILTGARVSEIANSYILPSIENGTLGDGLVKLTAEIGAILIVEYDGSASGTGKYPIGWIPLEWWHWGLIILGIVVLSIVTRGRILWPIVWLLGSLGRGRGRFGGGRSGGGGARGRY